MIARARAIAHGNAYTTYATLKENAQFICCETQPGGYGGIAHQGGIERMDTG